ncbi:MAG TPA: glycosyltransferase family 39 protein [Anaerolineae bacterium]|nr:glycosyltransferase family 39 protein [Anaerolineae bacterium]
MNLSQKRYWLSVILLLWLASWMRFGDLGQQSFWNDEGNSARLSERSIQLIIEGTASDVHPPLYYLLLRGWRELVGESEFGLRSLSVVAGVLTVAATMGVGRRWGAWVSIGAGMAVSVSAPLIYYSQEARMYSLLALWGTLGTLLLLKILEGERYRWWAAGYGLVVAAGLYTHYFFPVMGVVHGLVVLNWWWRAGERERLGWWLGAGLAGVVVYGPWVPIFWRQTGGRPSEGDVWLFMQEMSGWLWAGLPGTEMRLWPAWVVLAGLAVWGWWRKWVDGEWICIVVGTVVVPWLAMVVAGAQTPAFYKFMVVAVPGLGWGVGMLARRGFMWWWRMGVVGVVFLCLSWGAEAQQAYTRADYRGMAAHIKASGGDEIGVILNAPNQWEVFTYYFDDVARVYPLPLGYPDKGQIEGALSEIVTKHERLYVLFWGEGQRDPERLVERWLDEHTFKATEQWVGDVRQVMYSVPPTLQRGGEPLPMAVALEVGFGEDIVLAGYTLANGVLADGEVVEVTLFWRGERPLATRYKVFLHLTDMAGNMVAQRDSEPGGGLLLTTEWTPGEVVRDNHGIFVPVGTEAGEYILWLGLYDVADPTARLVVEGGGDRYELGRIVVE